MDNTQIIHTLEKPLKYTPKNAGIEVEAQFITLNEPCTRNLSACAPLKQAFMRVLAKNASNATAETAPTADAPSVASETAMSTSIMHALYASDAVDVAVIFAHAKELFKDVALVDGEKKMTTPMLDALSIADMEALTGKYLENFILASVLRAT